MGHDSPYLDELAEFHSQSVNPTELSVSHTIFESIVTSITSKHILVRLALSCACFTTDRVEPRVRPMPDVARFFSPGDFASLAKNDAMLDVFEEYLRTTRDKMSKVINERTTPEHTRHFLRINDMQAARLACGKPARSEFAFGSQGSTEFKKRLPILQSQWLKWVGTKLGDEKMFQKHIAEADVQMDEDWGIQVL